MLCLGFRLVRAYIIKTNLEPKKTQLTKIKSIKKTFSIMKLVIFTFVDVAIELQ